MGGINTYAYALSRPTLGIDPFGLFAQTTDVSWGMANNIGGWWNFGQLGGTNASVTTSCSCTQECGDWKLVECVGKFQVEVLIRNESEPLRVSRRAPSVSQAAMARLCCC